MLFTISIDLFLLQGKDGQVEENAGNGHDQPTNGTGSQGIPEPFFLSTYHERDKTKDGRDYRQKDRDYLGIPGLDIGTDEVQARIAATDGIELVQNVDAGIDRNTT